MGLLGWALVFLVIALMAGIAKILFFIFLAIFVVLLVMVLLGVGAAAA